MAGFVVHFGHGAAVFAELDVDECDGAAVVLGLLIHQLEDAGRAGERHHHHVELHGDLAERVDEGARQGEQGDEGAEGKLACAGETEVAHAGERHESTDDGKQNVEDVAHVAHDWHGHVAPGVRFGGSVEQFLVLLVEGLLGGVLMVEDLDDLLTVDGFLDEGVHIADPHLLLDEVAAGAGDDGAHDYEQDRGEHEHEERDRHRQPQHGDQCGQCGDRGREHLREGLADGLAQGVGVVGVAAHDVAVLVGVEVADRQRLLVCEHVVADLLQGALFDGDDEPLPQPAAESAGRVEAGHQRQGAQQRVPVGVLHTDQRQDVAVNQGLQEQRGTGLCGRTDQDAQHDCHDMPFVLENVAEDALSGSRRGFLRYLRSTVRHGIGALGFVSLLRVHALRGFLIGCCTHVCTSFHCSSSGWAWFLVCDS